MKFKNKNSANKKFLYEKQQNRKSKHIDEEDLVYSDDESQNEQEEIEEISKNSQESVEESEESHSDSDSEIEIYKEETENIINPQDNLENINLTLEEKEKINNLFLDSI